MQRSIMHTPTHMQERVEDLARSVLQQPLRVTVGLKNAAVPNVRQRLQFVGREAGKLLALRQLLADGGLAPPVLVFVGSKERAKALHRCGCWDWEGLKPVQLGKGWAGNCCFHIRGQQLAWQGTA